MACAAGQSPHNTHSASMKLCLKLTRWVICSMAYMSLPQPGWEISQAVLQPQGKENINIYMYMYIYKKNNHLSSDKMSMSSCPVLSIGLDELKFSILCNTVNIKAVRHISENRFKLHAIKQIKYRNIQQDF